MKFFLIVFVVFINISSVYANDDAKPLYKVLIKKSKTQIDLYGNMDINKTMTGYKSYPILNDTVVFYNYNSSKFYPIPKNLINFPDNTDLNWRKLGCLAHVGKKVIIASKYKKDEYKLIVEPDLHKLSGQCGSQNSAKVSLFFNNKKIISELVLNTYCMYGFTIYRILIDMSKKYIRVSVSSDGCEVLEYGKTAILQTPIKFLQHHPIDNIYPLEDYLYSSDPYMIYGGSGVGAYIPAR